MADAGARPPLAVFDLDGVLADVRHRLRHVERTPKDWDAFFDAAPDDPVHPQGLALVREALARGNEVVFLTGRPERCRQDTIEWLGALGLVGHTLHMRGRGDRRPAATVKRELIRRFAADSTVAAVVDDDERVVATLRADGWPVLHATWEAEARTADQQATLQRAQETEGRT